jgi:predicted Ser/Thr protein kinase
MSTDQTRTTERQRRVDEALAGYLGAVEEGRSPAPELQERWLALYPDLAAELEDFFADHAWIESWMSTVPGDGSEAARPDPGFPAIRGYTVLREIGRGGMGVVYEARQEGLDRRVALKVIRYGPSASAADVGRFRREAEAVARLDHDNIVKIHEVGESGGWYYFSMDLIPGGSLAARVSHYAAAPRSAARLVVDVARAIDHAHRRGLLHRDLKPLNILLGPDDRPIVTDFGLAKQVEESAGPTTTGDLVGTPAYMAGVQAAGKLAEITTATDVYGLGAILYELLTGHPPFRADSLLELLPQVKEVMPKPPRQDNPRVPEDLEVICLKCLDKDPKRRYATARDLAEDLERWLDARPIAARKVGRARRAWRAGIAEVTDPVADETGRVRPVRRADRVVANLRLFEHKGGLQASTNITGGQCDAPFGWAPLHLIAVEGLRAQGATEAADRVSANFLSLVLKGFIDLEPGTVFEKYDVVRRDFGDGGGLRFRYTTSEEGYGWTNAVFTELYAQLPERRRAQVLDPDGREPPGDDRSRGIPSPE